MPWEPNGAAHMFVKLALSIGDEVVHIEEIRQCVIDIVIYSLTLLLSFYY